MRQEHGRGQSLVSIVRRLGSTPQQRGSQQGMNCPDIFALSDGSIAYIGRDMTEQLRDMLPADAGIGADEKLVVLPWDAVRDALSDMGHA
ncbi:MAG TPA: hypothetical protein VGM10_18160 [Actinocrinis sp.]|jgi:hypothetical protein